MINLNLLQPKLLFLSLISRSFMEGGISKKCHLECLLLWVECHSRWEADNIRTIRQLDASFTTKVSL